MTNPSRSIEWIVWGGLGLVLAGIAAAFLTARRGKSSGLAAPPAPVYGTVSEFALTNQFGKTVTLSGLKGRLWIADIIFTRCPGPCAKMTKTMAALRAALPGDGSVKLVSLTADPEFDTPEVLHQYAERLDARAAHWHFLTGPKPQIYNLAIDDLKLAVGEIPPEERKAVNELFIHSTRFILVDGEGRVRGFFDGERPGSIPEIVSAVEALMKEKGL